MVRETRHGYGKREMSNRLEREIDFFVAPKALPTGATSWLVYRGSLVACIDADGDLPTALSKAVKHARFCVLGGQAAQVHVRERHDGAWRTVWCVSETSRRFP